MQELFRTRNGKHYNLGNGQIQSVLTIHDQHFKNQDGLWDDVIEEWDLTETKGPNAFGPKLKKASHNLRATPNKLRVGFEKQKFIEIGIPTDMKNIVGKKLVGTMQGFQTSYEITNRGVRKEIIVPTADCPSEFVFPLSAVNCGIRQVGQMLEYFDDNGILAISPAPFIVDANGEIGTCQMIWNGSQYALLPDLYWMSQRQGPFIIDPTTTLQPDGAAGKDAFVYQGIPSQTSGTNYMLEAGWGSSAARENICYLFLDVSGYPNITSATMQLKEFYAYQPSPIATYPITSSWDEGTVTWDTKPTLGSPEETFAALTLNAWNNFNILAIVNSNNYGVALRTTGAYIYNYKYRFYSSDYTDSTLRPKIILEWTEASGGVPVFGTIGKLGRRLLG